MKNDTRTLIGQLLEQQKKITPLVPSIDPDYRKDTSIKALIFDIYGTLLISSWAEGTDWKAIPGNLKTALDYNSIRLTSQDNKPTGQLLMKILNLLREKITAYYAQQKSEDVPFPEMNIVKIWEQTLIHAREKGWIKYPDDVDFHNLTLTFELLNNRAWPMPDMMEVIHQLSDKKFPLGIISNAQFYTPRVMNYFLSGSYKESETVDCFDPDLTVFSYKLLRGKPDVALFEKLIPVLKTKYNLKPEQVAYVGNDMKKDVYTARQAGFKTILFAGDKNSVRWRKDDPGIDGVKPDFIITELKQLIYIVE